VYTHDFAVLTCPAVATSILKSYALPWTLPVRTAVLGSRQKNTSASMANTWSVRDVGGCSGPYLASLGKTYRTRIKKPGLGPSQSSRRIPSPAYAALIILSILEVICC